MWPANPSVVLLVYPMPSPLILSPRAQHTSLLAVPRTLDACVSLRDLTLAFPCAGSGCPSDLPKAGPFSPCRSQLKYYLLGGFFLDHST